MNIFFVSFIVASLAYCVLCQDEELARAFSANRINPDVIDERPNIRAAMTWSGGVQANLGNTIPRSRTTFKPNATYAADLSDFYTLILIDMGNFIVLNGTRLYSLLWRVVNIRGNDVNTDSEEDFRYTPPALRDHLIVILVFRQRKRFPTRRDLNLPYFSVKNYATNNNLTVIGGNFFRTDNELLK